MTARGLMRDMAQHGRKFPARLIAAWSLLMMLPAPVAQAEVRTASPANYRHHLGALKAGDTLQLTPGFYRDGLPVHGLRGRKDAAITITGPATGGVVFIARPRHNTISIADSRHVELRHLRIESNGVQVDAIKAEGGAQCKPSPFVTIDSLTIIGYGQHQQNVAISTKCAAWGWVIRNNTIVGAGTGLYLGDSDGSAAFVDGRIENNLVSDTIGYALQIKHQRSWSGEIPNDVIARRTVISGNTFIKSMRSARDTLARPNLLIGHPPAHGRGKAYRYEIHGNVFIDNPHEALFQGEGNLVLYNNILLNRFRTNASTIAIQPHNDIPRDVRIFNNTIITPGTCIKIVAATDNTQQHVVSNLLFCDIPIIGGHARRNVSAPYARADQYLNSPYGRDGVLDAMPIFGALRGVDGQMNNDAQLPAIEQDFNGASRSGAFAGALASEGINAKPIEIPYPIDTRR